MKKKFLSLGTAFLIAVGVGLHPMVVSANTKKSELSFDNSLRTEGLISMVSLSIGESNGDLSLTATTRSNSVMSSIGLINISVQHSPNGYSSWTEETTITNKLKSNSTIYTLSEFKKNVEGNHYYRVQLNHYANNGAGTIQSEPNTSNVIWIS